MAVNISVDLEERTWGELRQFVRLADKTGVPDDLKVGNDSRGGLLLRGAWARTHGPAGRAGEVTTGGPVTPCVTRDNQRDTRRTSHAYPPDARERG